MSLGLQVNPPAFFQSVPHSVCLLGDYDTKTRQWKKRMSEHFFLTDPEELIYTHFPFLEGDHGFDK